MLVFKSFKVSEIEKMNEFMKTHQPLPTKEGMSITFQEGHAIMWYEDGQFDEKMAYKSSLEFAITESKANLVSKKIGLETAADELYQLIPQVDYEGKSAGQLVTFFQEKGLNYKQAQEMAQLAADLDQKRWLAEKEIHRMEKIMIPRLEKLLKDNT